jgi:hypothetical protein
MKPGEYVSTNKSKEIAIATRCTKATTMKKYGIAGLALSLVLAASCYGRPKDAGTPATRSDATITIRVLNYADVKPASLLSAERTATDILRKAGVDSVWIECGGGQAGWREPGCSSPVTPLDLVVNLLPRSLAQPLHFRVETLGAAVESTGKNFGFFAYVFYDNVKDCAVQESLDLAQLLGDTIVHELAHLLLGAHSHSNSGVMSPCWRGREFLAVKQSRLFFSSSEQKRLQATLAARTLAASSSSASPELHPATNTQSGLATARK